MYNFYTLYQIGASFYFTLNIFFTENKVFRGAMNIKIEMF